MPMWAKLSIALQDALVYKTVKLVRTKDKFLLALHFTMSGTVMIFTFISVIVLHNYMKFEKPVIATSVNFVTRGGKRFSNVQCTDALSVTETTRPLLKGEWVLSYFKQTTIQRSCAEKNRVTFASCFDTVIGWE